MSKPLSSQRSSSRQSGKQQSRYQIASHVLSAAGAAIVLSAGQSAYAKDPGILDFELAESPYAKQSIASTQPSIPVTRSTTGSYSATNPVKSLYSAPGMDRDVQQSPLNKKVPDSAPNAPNAPNKEWLPAYQTGGTAPAARSQPSLKNSGGALSFEPPPTPWQAQQAQRHPQPTGHQSESSGYQPIKRAFTTYEAADLFAGGTDSLVAKAIGAAEGTRTPHGIRTPAYYGHIDPGNGVWNLGTFSFQHGANSPEEADQKQLARLQTQAEVLQTKAIERGMTLSLEEKLNGIDLANQAPLAALGEEGYIDWLKQAHELGMRGAEAVIWARTRSFIDPATGTWDAPGLGNNVGAIFDDQERRVNAIVRAIAAHSQEGDHGNLSVATKPIATPPQSPVSQVPVPAQADLQPPPKPQLEPLPATRDSERIHNSPALLPKAPEVQASIANPLPEEAGMPGSRAFTGKTMPTVPIENGSARGFAGFAPGLSSSDGVSEANTPAATVGDRQDTADLIIFQDLP